MTPSAAVDMLDGNVFQCADRSSLPQTDPISGSYACVSGDFNDASNAWLVSLGVLVGIRSLCFRSRVSQLWRKRSECELYLLSLGKPLVSMHVLGVL